MYKVGDKVIVIYEDWLNSHPEFRNKIFTITYKGTIVFDINYEGRGFGCTANAIKKVSTLLSEFLKSL